jgi:hypothetical protein
MVPPGLHEPLLQATPPAMPCDCHILEYANNRNVAILCALQCVVSMTTAALETDSTLDAALSDGEKLWHRLTATSCAKVF